MGVQPLVPWQAGERHERGLTRPEFLRGRRRPAVHKRRELWVAHARRHQALCEAQGSQASHAKRRGLFASGNIEAAQRMLDEQKPAGAK